MENERSKTARLSLPSDREIAIVRELRAPRDIVFETWSRPEHVRHWYPCTTLTMPGCEMDFRVGGQWRYVLRDRKTGNEHALSGEYQLIERPAKLVFTERYEPVPGSDHVVTVSFVERDGVTELTQHFLYPSKESRDGHLRSGMANGLEDLFERMDATIETIRGSR